MTTTEQIKKRIRIMRDADEPASCANLAAMGFLDLVEKLLEEQEGMVLVSVEPDEAEIRMGICALRNNGDEGGDLALEKDYEVARKVMIAASSMIAQKDINQQEEEDG